MKVARRLLSWILAIVMIVGVLQTNTVTAYATSSGITISNVQMTVGGKTLSTSETNEVNYGSDVTLSFDFAMANSAFESATVDDVYVIDLPSGLTFDTIDNDDLKDNGEVVGVYSITGSQFRFQLNEDFLNRSDRNLKGQANLTSTVDASHGYDNVDKDATWSLGNDTYNVSIKADTSDYGLSINKSTTDWNTSSLTDRGFKITIKSKGSNTLYKLEDALGSNMELSGSFTVTKNGETVGDATASGTDITFGEGLSLSNNDEVVITYNVNVKDDVFKNSTSNQVYLSGESNGLNNTATATYKVNGEGDDKTVSSTSGLSVEKTWLKKSGSYDKKSGEITWTIKLNASGAPVNLNGATIKDSLGDGQTYVEDSLTIDSGLGQDFSFTDLTGNGVTLSGINLTGSYTITYRTKPESTSATEKTTYTNTASIQPSGSENWISTDASVGVGSNWKYIEKSRLTDNGSESKVSWQIKVNIPEGYNAAADGAKVVSDTLPEGMTLVADSIQITKDGSEDTASTTTDGAFPITLDISVGDDGTANANQTFVITYDTEVTDTAKDESYKNTATFNGKSDEATYKFSKTNEAPTVNKDVAEGDWSNTGVAKWSVTVKDASMLKSIEDNAALQLVDTLPEGLEYAEGSAQFEAYSMSQTWSQESAVALTPSVTRNADGTTTLTFDVSAYASYYKAQANGTFNGYNIPRITYKTKVSNIGSLKYNKNYSYKNSAHWVLGEGESAKVGDDTTKTYHFNNNGSVLNKTGRDLKAGRLSYTVVANANALTLNNGKEYSLTDTLGTGIDYTMGSLKVAKDGEEAVTWSGADKVSYDSTTHTLVIMGLSDGVKYTITYNATTNLKAGTVFDSQNGSNSIRMTGSSSDALADSYQLSGKASASSASIVTDGKTINIYKYGNGDGSKKLSNATFALYDLSGEDGNSPYDRTQGGAVPSYSDLTPVTRVTGSTGRCSFTGLVQDHLYVIVETKAPMGYEKSADEILFVFQGTSEDSPNYIWPDNATIYTDDVATPTVNVNNDKASETKKTVKISKVDVAGTEIEGAKLQIINADTQNEVESWTSEAGKTHETTLEPGNYTLVETTAPSGYQKAESINFTLAKDGTVTVTSAGAAAATADDNGVYTVKMKDQEETFDVVISKQDLGGKEIAGASLKITHIETVEGESASTTTETKTDAEWTSVAGKSRTVSLKAGTYTLTEETAPNGYKKAESITFSVDNKGNVTSDAFKDGKVVMTDAYADKTVSISKKAVNGTEELTGASLTVYDADGNVAKTWNATESKYENASWMSTSTAKELTLAPGTYTLVETQAPNGYTIAESIEFTIAVDGTVSSGALEGNVIVMRDKEKESAKTEVKVSKTEITGTTEIKDAELVVLDKDGNEVESWTSDGVSAHSFTVVDGTYTLVENTAPDGYKVAEKITFTVENNKVSVGGTEQTDNKIVMKDAYAGTTVKISKTDVAGKELKGATLGLYSTYDANDATKCVKAKDQDNKDIEPWQSDGNTKKLTVIPGTYTLVETTAPNGYEKAESITFTVAADGTISDVTGGTVDDYGVITMVDEYKKTTVKISKVAVNGTKELKGAELSISDSTGKVVESWTSDGVNQKEVQLTAGTYTLTETTAPDGYEKAESITFTVNQDGTVTSAAASKGEDGKYVVQMQDAAKSASKKEVKISKQDVGGKEIKGATLTVTNAWGETVASYETDGVKAHSIYVVPGDYTLTETTAPDGYEKAESIAFTVAQDGTVTSNIKDGGGNVIGTNMKNGALVMTDEYKSYSVEIAKTDVAGKEIAGAKLSLTGTDVFGNSVAYDTTSVANKTWKLSLNPGEYTLKETQAPMDEQGNTIYEIASDITFTLNSDGSITTEAKRGENGEIVMVDDYKTYEVTINKKDNSNNALAGASLAINGTTKNGVAITEIAFKTTTEAKKVKLQPGSYVLSETKTPDGDTQYETAANIAFEVTAGGKVTVDGKEQSNLTLTMIDKVKEANTYDLKVSKQDIAGKEIAGAVLTITGTAKQANGTTAAIEAISWTSDGKNPQKVTLAEGTYKLTETTAPDGYTKAEEISFTIEKNTDGNLIVKSDNFKDGRLVMKDNYTEHAVVISKQDVIGNEIDGAHLKVTGRVTGATEDIKAIEWDSKKDETKTIQLQPGDYTLTETTAPAGYEIASSIDFTVDVKGVVTSKAYKNGQIVMTDDWAEKAITISKEDITKTKEIGGATLTITGEQEDGTKIQTISFKTTEGSTTEFKLLPGTYTLTESSAPDGYEKAESIRFKVTTDDRLLVNGVEPKDKDDKVTNTVTMLDDYANRTITVSKRDIADSEEITGAQLTITDNKKDKVVDTWTSEAGKPHGVVYNWDPSATYTLTEVSSAPGYESLTTNITFTVNEKGEVTLQKVGEKNDKAEGIVATDGTLVVYNTAIPYTGDNNNNGGGDGGNEGGNDSPKTTTVTNNKRKPAMPKFHIYLVRTDEETGEGLEGGVYELYKENGEKVGTYTTNEAGVIYVDGLEPGNYYFVEIEAPKGYQPLGWNKIFEVSESGTAEILAVSTGRISANPDFRGQENGVGGATGDNSMMATYGCVAALAAAALVIWFAMRRKRQNI